MTGAYWLKSFVIFPLDRRGDNHSMTAVAVFLSFGARVRGGCGLKLLLSCLVRVLLFKVQQDTAVVWPLMMKLEEITSFA